EGSRNQDWL
nr:Chain C, nonameric peptide murine gp100 [synthetic construct]3CCH_F Chain F, nonameric peptide murine gp100 [synthetic construct]3CCH_I Chain I, nonameric peptide murine gp100 [synthetic construct]3CCH_L Chain L, nonameric peptide murine gp100 [synthetic construct]